MPFNPFEKPIGTNLDAADLDVLVQRSVAEGYYIEYKQTFPNNDKIGRSIASLANTYGGWYIVGVKTNSDNAANDICGFSRVHCPDPLDKIREIVKTHIDPTPLFLPQVVELPSGDIVLLVYVPAEQQTPFVTRDGRIYRRTNDSSDPIPENNRFTIDKLFDDGRRVAERFQHFCVDERVFSKKESENGWLSIFLSPHPHGISHQPMTDYDGINNLLAMSQTPTLHLDSPEGRLFTEMPLDSGKYTHRSVVLRQTSAKMADNSLSIELFWDGRAKLHIPFEYCSNEEATQSPLAALAPFKNEDFNDYIVKSLKSKSDKDYDLYMLRFFKFDRLLIMVISLIGFYRRWLLLRTDGISEIELGAKISRAWRHVPYAATKQWEDFATTCGVPVVTEDSFSVLDNRGRGYIFKLDRETTLELRFIPILGLAFGFPAELTHRLMDSLKL